MSPHDSEMKRWPDPKLTWRPSILGCSFEVAREYLRRVRHRSPRSRSCSTRRDTGSSQLQSPVRTGLYSRQTASYAVRHLYVEACGGSRDADLRDQRTPTSLQRDRR